MFKKLLFFLDKKSKIQILLIQIIFVLTTFLEFLNLNVFLAFLISIFSKEYQNDLVKDLIFIDLKSSEITSSSELGIVLVITFFLSSTLILFSNYIIFYFSHYLKAKLINTYFIKTLNANYLYAINKGASGVIHDVNNEIPKISDGIIMPSLKILNKLFLLFAILIFLFSNFFKISIIMLGISSVLIFLFYIILKKYFYDFGVRVSISQNNVIKSLHETFSNLQVIKIFKIENFFITNVHKNLKLFAKYQSLGYLFGGIPKYFFEILAITIVTFVFIYFSNEKYDDLDTLIPVIGTFAFVGYRLLPIFQEIFTSLSMIKNSQYASSKILNKYLFNKNNYKKKTQVKFDKVKINKIQIDNLYFSYLNNKKNIFKNFSISFETNKITTITGKSGVGKTTLINILNGLIVPQKINFKVNEKKVENNYYYKIISDKISYNDQKPALFNASIKQNVTLNFNFEKVNKKLYFQALQDASLNELKPNLRRDGKVGSGGFKLSGGQIQRLLIARALYHKKDVLIFDEPTNFLDEKNKNKIIKSIRNIKKNRIIIILSHDKKILNISDKIVKL